MSEDDFSNVYTWKVVEKMWHFCYKVLALCMEGDGGLGSGLGLEILHITDDDDALV